MSSALAGPSARSGIAPFHVMDVWAAAGERQRTRGDLINLSAGQPSTPAPVAVRARAAAALEQELLGYTVALGIPELRAGIAGHHGRTYGIAVDPDDVVVTTAGSGGFLLAFLAAFDVGDRVAMARPGYPCYRNILTALGCEVVELPCGPGTFGGGARGADHQSWQPTVEMIEGLDLKGLIVASPANPTGTVLDPRELAALASHCEERGIQLVSDEIYHGIGYPGSPATACAWQTSREAIVVNSFSKYFSMTGWRLGWLLVPERLRRAVDRLAGNLTVCPPALPQHAAVAAFTPESYAEADSHVERYAVNRGLLLDGLPGLGIDRLAPADGAFYVYADVGHLTDDSMRLTYELLDATGIAVAPGVDFDPVEGHRFVRLSFAGATGPIVEALERLRPFVAARSGR